MRSVVLTLLVAGVAHADPPHVVTQAWLRKQARVDFSILDDVDAKQGLVMIRHIADVADDSIPEIVTGSRSCGDELATALPALRKAMKRAYRGADTFTCHNQRDGLAWCSYQEAFEYSTAYSIVLRKNADGALVPDAVLETDAGSMDDASYARMRSWIGTKWKVLRSVDCDGTTIDPPVSFPADFTN